MTLLTTAPIRRLSPADLPRCLDLSADRGWSRENRKWRLLLTAGTGYGIDDPDGDGLIGCFVLTRYGRELACVSMVLVAERHARRGLGRRLVTHALEEAAGTPVFIYATESGRSLYEQLGFRPVSRSTTRTGRFRPEPPVPASAAQATRRATAADLPAILELDAEVFGSDRMHLLTRLPAFVEQVRVTEGPGGRLTGFAAAWRNVHNTVIGPVVAKNTGTAQRLIADLAVRTEGEVRMDVDTRHAALESWLDTRGVTPVTANTLMVHGASILPGDHRRRFAPLMVALG
ncbi:GNAT family N-acetyltransferase [Streptomyces sp. 7N604]|uniref:GNAT family N-acetyltransferase n=1 Tax=Streptomyces sp. 7N604 TaxID=3457415 RepID=UPI003FCEF698